jgi:hypothetical protein
MRYDEAVGRKTAERKMAHETVVILPPFIINLRLN